MGLSGDRALRNEGVCGVMELVDVSVALFKRGVTHRTIPSFSVDMADCWNPEIPCRTTEAARPATPPIHPSIPSHLLEGARNRSAWFCGNSVGKPLGHLGTWRVLG